MKWQVQHEGTSGRDRGRDEGRDRSHRCSFADMCSGGFSQDDCCKSRSNQYFRPSTPVYRSHRCRPFPRPVPAARRPSAPSASASGPSLPGSVPAPRLQTVSAVTAAFTGRASGPLPPAAAHVPPSEPNLTLEKGSAAPGRTSRGPSFWSDW